MKITVQNIHISPIRPDRWLVAFASTIVNDGLCIGSIGIHEKSDGTGYRLTYPTRRSKGCDRHVFHPVTLECSKVLETAILEAYERLAKTINHDRHDRPDFPDPSL